MPEFLVIVSLLELRYALNTVCVLYFPWGTFLLFDNAKLFEAVELLQLCTVFQVPFEYFCKCIVTCNFVVVPGRPVMTALGFATPVSLIDNVVLTVEVYEYASIIFSPAETSSSASA